MRAERKPAEHAEPRERGVPKGECDPEAGAKPAEYTEPREARRTKGRARSEVQKNRFC